MTEYENKGVTVKQSNLLTQSRFDLTSIEMNILFALLYEMKANKFQGNFFNIKIDSIMKLTDNKKQHLIDAAKSLMNRTYEKKDGKSFTVVNFISSATFTNGDLVIEVSEKIMPEYTNLERFTEFEIKTALGVSSKYSKRIYTILSQFRNSRMTTADGDRVFNITLQDLRRRLDLDENETGKTPLQNWGMFKQRVLDVAKKQLNEADSDLSFDYKVAKQQRKKVVSIDFILIIKKARLPEVDNMINLLVDIYKLAMWQAVLLVDNVALNKIHDVLKLIHAKIYDRTKPVENVGGYSVSVFNDLFPELGLKQRKTEQLPAVPPTEDIQEKLL